MEDETEMRLNQLREAEQTVRQRYGRAAPSMLAGLPLAYDERLAALRRMAGGGGSAIHGAQPEDRSRTQTQDGAKLNIGGSNDGTT